MNDLRSFSIKALKVISRYYSIGPTFDNSTDALDYLETSEKYDQVIVSMGNHKSGRLSIDYDNDSFIAVADHDYYGKVLRLDIDKLGIGVVEELLDTYFDDPNSPILKPYW